MRRHSHRSVVLAALAAAAVLTLAGVAGAQTTATTTTPPVTAVPPTTVPATVAVPTTVPATVTTTGGATTASTVAPLGTTVPITAANESSDDSDIPWVPIAIGAIALVALVTVITVLARKRGARRQRAVDWRRQGADATAEAGATARLLSQGTPASGQIARQIVSSLRTFEDLARSAPDETAAAIAERGRRALQTLGLAIDADYRLRRAQPAPDAAQVSRSQESVQTAAGETDRALRGVYRSLTDTD